MRSPFSVHIHPLFSPFLSLSANWRIVSGICCCVFACRSLPGWSLSSEMKDPPLLPVSIICVPFFDSEDVHFSPSCFSAPSPLSPLSLSCQPLSCPVFPDWTLLDVACMPLTHHLTLPAFSPLSSNRPLVAFSSSQCPPVH